ncbi:cytochrome C [Henriciella barbarensis]|uniref:Cytochrome C n=1 Tax=Henriciella barbarensis TaxID=86342 RepID=A0A399R235_9PROT|nr:NAD(P)/FAD-dependent oxidoreductase [Henriciella barbarensis]RIJ24574.1 cytochrome C [Henriciella barbarensis]
MTGAPKRRDVLAGLAGTAALPLLSSPALAQSQPRIVIVGGGFGGAAAARYVKTYLPGASVTLIEPQARYTACPFSNLVIAGLRSLEAQQFGYDNLKAIGIKVIGDRAEDVDAGARTVTLGSGDRLAYDKLILSPGIDIRWDALEGYDEDAATAMPHAWKAGPQTSLLREQLEAMPDGGTVIMSVPTAPYRCPPGPYERASLIAHYFKTRKPASKLIILDAKDEFSKQPLFLEAWAEHYPDHLEWIGASDFGRVISVDPGAMTLSTDFDTYEADVANVIPPQKAGEIAARAGVADQTGWCPINPVDFSSTLQPGIYVIGDATIAAPMPKSAFSANLQAKLCALQIARELKGEALAPTILANTCYSYVTPDAAVSITGVYSNKDGQLSSIESSGGLSPADPAPSVRAAEAAEAEAWFEQITLQTFG